MSFLPDWWSQGVQGQDSNGGFGTAAMFDDQKALPADVSSFMPGEWDWMKKIKMADLLKGTQSKQPTFKFDLPQTNRQPQFTPYQDAQQVGPNVGQAMPNWNRTYGGY